MVIIMSDQENEDLVGVEVSKATIPIEEESKVGLKDLEVSNKVLAIVAILFFLLGFYYGRTL